MSNFALSTSANPFQAPAGVQPSEDNVTRGNFKKASAYINIYLPNTDGGKRKLGSIRLYEDKAPEAELINWLKEDPSRIGQLMGNAIIDFQSADASTSSGFALPK